MKNKRSIAVLVLVACLSVMSGRVAGETIPPPAARPGVTVELEQLVEKTKAKLQAGADTEAACHSERSEESREISLRMLAVSKWILHFAQNDKHSR